MMLAKGGETKFFGRVQHRPAGRGDLLALDASQLRGLHADDTAMETSCAHSMSKAFLRS